MKILSSSNVATMVAQQCGYPGYRRLIEACGGNRIRIPKSVTGKYLDLFGEDVLAVLVDNYGGMDVDIPSRGGAERTLRSLRLKDDIVSTPLSANEIASKHGVTASYVHKLRHDLLDKPKPELTKAKA